MSKQLLRSGTSIGANIQEAQQAQSRPDFIHKMSIALKEAQETEYWLLLFKESDLVTFDFNHYLFHLLAKQTQRPVQCGHQAAPGGDETRLNQAGEHRCIVIAVY